MYEKIMYYAKTGELKKFTSLEEANEFALFSCRNLISGGGDFIRERVSIDLVHGEHYEEKHGWDGRKGNYFLEVKNETIGINENGEKTVSGRGIFNNLTWKSFQKYETQKGVYISVGYSRTGVLLYAIAFDIKHILPILEEALLEKLPNREDKQKTNVSVSISAAQFPKEVEVLYIPKVLIWDNYSENLLKLLANNKSTKLSSRRLTTPIPQRKKTSGKVVKQTNKPTNKQIKEPLDKSNVIIMKTRELYPNDFFIINDSDKKIYFDSGKTLLFDTVSKYYSKLVKNYS